MKELTIHQLSTIISEMEAIARQHPKANVTYDTEKHRIDITYSLPKSFYKIQSIALSTTKPNKQ